MNSSSPEQIYNAKLIALGERFHPTSCHWEVTTRCNARCDYCYARGLGIAELSTRQMLQVADSLARNGILNVTISGGEPFCRTDIAVLLKRLMDDDMFWLILMTNATLISADHLDFLAVHHKRFAYVQISAFSHRPELNDAYFKVKGALAKQTETARLLRDAGFRVRIALNVFEFNFAEISQTRDFFQDMGFATNTSHQKITCPGNGIASDSYCVGSAFYREFLECSGEQIRGAWEKSMETRGRRPTADRPPCNGVRCTICVDPAGDVSPCSLLRSVRVGNILDACPLESMLRSSEEYCRLRKTTHRDFVECQSCEFHGFCTPCLGLNFLETGDYYKPARQTCEFAEAVARLVGEST